MPNRPCAACRNVPVNSESLSLGICPRCWRRGWAAPKLSWDPLDGYELAARAERAAPAAEEDEVTVRFGAVPVDFAA